MGDGRREATAADIRKALRVFQTACILQWLLLAGYVVGFSPIAVRMLLQ